MTLLMPSNANPTPTHKFPATKKGVQKFERCELVAAATVAGDRDINERCAGPVGVKVKTASPAAVHSVWVLRDIKDRSGEKGLSLTGMKRLPITVGDTMLQETGGLVTKRFSKMSLFKHDGGKPR